MKHTLLLIVIISTLNLAAQNVGVNTTNPTERLDVNGNINVTGTIKANGVDGTANQVLTKNNSGVLAWGDLCNYKNVAAFTTTGSGTWIVPAGVTKILVEVWGGGAGGSNAAGGGGGGYIRAAFTVAPGDEVVYVVGEGGTDVNADLAGSNGSVSAAGVGPYTATAFGGTGGGGTQTGMSVPHGGLGAMTSGSPAHKDFIALSGETGKFSVNTFFNNGATYYEHAYGADGGDGANSQNTGGMGRMRLHTTSPTSIIKSTSSSPGRQPGGGGGGAFNVLSNGSTGVGGSGGAGLVMIRY
jgi:hypothetical protein